MRLFPCSSGLLGWCRDGLDIALTRGSFGVYLFCVDRLHACGERDVDAWGMDAVRGGWG